jgi:CDP-diacylglycerol--glycerol-3-phosphate 3-phosphatidyltransferase
MNIPNQLTLLRILLIPVFVLMFYLPYEWNNLMACIVFSLAGITDALDGYLARKLNQTSSLGAFLDPVADKLMVAVALVLLVQQDPNLLLALAAAIIIGREITVSALREWMAEIGARSKVAVSVLGKIKTIAQLFAIGFLIFKNSVFGLPVYEIGLVLLYIAAFLTIISMFQYLLAAWPQLKE